MNIDIEPFVKIVFVASFILTWAIYLWQKNFIKAYVNSYICVLVGLIVGLYAIEALKFWSFIFWLVSGTPPIIMGSGLFHFLHHLYVKNFTDSDLMIDSQ